MPDFIRLLPDSVANQIAAGEVIQRPASAVKELLENAIDAGSNQIKLILKDAGRTLIQVIDNGTGMSVTDARMCFERHATSKIKEANDLFAIRTLGFRGEALASIAAVAQVELRTRKEFDEIGTCIQIEGTKFKSQEEVSTPKGTSISAKNLFFNIPARRNFLKSDAVEFRHILEEFQRVALVHHEIELSLYHNDKPIFQLMRENLRQRIVHIFGNTMNEKLLPVELQTEMSMIYGFIGKPETARKTRGEQYFFANGRFIKHPYLHHAIEQAFEELIPDSAIPSYFLFIEVDPSSIDVNIHPTKTEVNFQHGQVLYASMRSAVKQALGMFSLSPTIDFEAEQAFDFNLPANYLPKPPSITVNPDYNPFLQGKNTLPRPSTIQPNRSQWEKAFEVIQPSENEIHQTINSDNQVFASQQILHQEEVPEQISSSVKPIQVQNRFIMVNVKSGLMILDQQKAHERILFERILNQGSQPKTAQSNLFPPRIQLSAIDSEILNELQDEFIQLGFEINDLGKGAYVVNSYPSDMPIEKIEEFIDGLLEDYKKNRTEFGGDSTARIAMTLSRNLAIKAGKVLQVEEMQSIIDELFGCQVPETAPDGSRILKILPVSEIEKLIK